MNIDNTFQSLSLESKLIVPDTRGLQLVQDSNIVDRLILNPKY